MPEWFLIVDGIHDLWIRLKALCPLRLRHEAGLRGHRRRQASNTSMNNKQPLYVNKIMILMWRGSDRGAIAPDTGPTYTLVLRTY